MVSERVLTVGHVYDRGTWYIVDRGGDVVR